MLMPGNGEWNGKALWQLVVLGDPRADNDWAGGGDEQVSPSCCPQRREAVVLFYLNHNLHASSC